MGADHPPARFLREAGLIVLPEEIRPREGRAWLVGWQKMRGVLRRLPVPVALATDLAKDVTWLHCFMTRLVHDPACRSWLPVALAASVLRRHVLDHGGGVALGDRLLSAGAGGPRGGGSPAGGGRAPCPALPHGPPAGSRGPATSRPPPRAR